MRMAVLVPHSSTLTIICWTLLLLMTISHCHTIRATASSTTEAPERCIGRTPCGWAVYDRKSRVIEYFMQNKCNCTEGKQCVRQDDDISITAYVYRCKSQQEISQEQNL